MVSFNRLYSDDGVVDLDDGVVDLDFLFAGTNFMTPHFVGYGRAGDYVFEVTTGRGFSILIPGSNDRIYGMTIAKLSPTPHLTNLSRMFQTQAELDDMIEQLTNGTLLPA